jgi:hypothetical protein
MFDACVIPSSMQLYHHHHHHHHHGGIHPIYTISTTSYTSWRGSNTADDTAAAPLTPLLQHH